MMLMNGTGTAVDPNAAFDWFKQAAERGDSLAQRWVAACYQRGQGVAVDRQEAAKWLRRSLHGQANRMS